MGEYGRDAPSELRGWNDTAPEVAVGMAGAPGHQARTIQRDGSPRPDGARGAYGNYPTMGGFDQMTARVGGFWDSMLGEGRRWWITANSDSHVNWREGGSDFWPGEYSKTYVWALKSHDAILEAIRAGRVFVTTGDLISDLDVSASGGGERAGIGGTLEVPRGGRVEIRIHFTDPAEPNAGGRYPSVARVDLISGEVRGPVSDRSSDTNPSTRVLARWSDTDWSAEGAERWASYVIEDVTHRSVCAGPRDQRRGARTGGRCPRGRPVVGSLVLLEPDLRHGALAEVFARQIRVARAPRVEAPSHLRDGIRSLEGRVLRDREPW